MYCVRFEGICFVSWLSPKLDKLIEYISFLNLIVIINSVMFGTNTYLHIEVHGVLFRNQTVLSSNRIVMAGFIIATQYYKEALFHRYFSTISVYHTFYQIFL